MKNKRINKILATTMMAVMVATPIISTAYAMEGSALDSTIQNTEDENIAEDINLGNMNDKEKEIFYQLLEEEVKNAPGNKELYRQALIGMFDPKAENFNDLDKTTEIMNKDPRARIRICSVQTLAAGLNLAIGVAAGGGVGAVQALIRNKGKEAAKRIFTKTVVSKLTALGAGKFAGIVGVAVGYALNYSDIGGYIARYIDSKDAVKNNGYIDI